MPVVYDDPAAPAPQEPMTRLPRGRLHPPEQSTSGEPLTVYATRDQLAVNESIRYLNDLAGFKVLRMTWYRPGADVVVKPIPQRVRWLLLHTNRAMAQAWASFVPRRPGMARAESYLGQNVIYTQKEGFNSRLYGPITPAQAREYTPFLPRYFATNGAAWITAHELGHALGLTHEDPTMYSDEWDVDYGTITTGGFGLSPFQMETIKELLEIDLKGE